MGVEANIPGGSLTLLSIYLLGLGLNLTPCVYPMMTVTISLFGGQKEPHHLRAFFRALMYFLGIAVTYSSLGVFAALTGGFFGAALQSKWVLLLISILLFALALSMFGLYVIQVPSGILNRIGGSRKVSLAGFFISGMLVGIVAAPCVGPPIVALLTLVGTRNDPLFGFWVFFVLSLGLGTPYLILGTFTGLLKKLPKSGVWMIWVERVFGVLLMGLAAFYLFLALMPQWVELVFPAGLVFGGLYLGFMETSEKYTGQFVRFKKTAGTLAIILGLISPMLAPQENVAWQPYSPERVAQAKREGRPVILDFYADWCIPCHELDRFTYSDPEVIQALDHFERIKVDVTDTESPESLEVLDQYHVMGVPTILFINARGELVEEARITGYVPPKALLSVIYSPKVSGKKS